MTKFDTTQAAKLFANSIVEDTPTKPQPFSEAARGSLIMGAFVWAIVSAAMLEWPGDMTSWQMFISGAWLTRGFFCGLGVAFLAYILYQWETLKTWHASRKTEPVLFEPDALPAQERIVDRPVLVNARKQAAAAPIGMAEFVRGCELGGTAEDRWLRTISPEQLVTWRDALIDAGWAKWNSREHRHGWSLTAPASEIVAAMDDGDAFDAVFDSIFRGW